MIAPERMLDVAPRAQFQFIAHLPETRLIFPLKNGDWDGGLPSVREEPGNTVWGAIFEVPTAELAAIDQLEAAEGRERAEKSAMDRAGRRHKVVTHVHTNNGRGDLTDEHTPSRDYMRMVLEGSRHWSLPAGWVAGLEEYVEDPLF